MRGLASLVLLAACGLPLAAQAARGERSAASGERQAVSEPQAPNAKPPLAVFLITIGQGQRYWEKYGHNMLWFYSPAEGIDVAFNWGTFDFDQPGFMKRQLVGDPLYSVDTVSSQAVFDAYRRLDRTITVQRLNLTPEQARKALERSRWNALPENRNYRYDYYLDNCSTRVRDMIDFALDGSLRRASGDRVQWTNRSETVRLLDDMKTAQFGVQLALGQPADRKLTVWEDMFIPMRLRDAVRNVRVAGPDSAMRPLVVEERVLYESSRFRDRADVPKLTIPYLYIGLALAAQILFFLALASRWNVFDRVLRWEVALWGLLTGLVGVALLFAWTSTRHVFWYRNESLLLFNPLALALVLLAPLSIRRARWTRPAAIVAALLAMFAALALILKEIPGSQRNLPLVLLMLPAQLAIAFALWRRTPDGRT